MHALVKAPQPVARSGTDILNAIRQPVLLELSRALRRAFAGTIDDLLARMLEETSWDERQSIGDSLDLLRNGREAIEARFDQACAETWVERTTSARSEPTDAAAGRKPGGASPMFAVAAAGPAGAAPAGEAGTSPPRGLTLSLIDDSLMSQQLQVGRIAARSRRRMDDDQVDGLRARFGALLGRDWFADNEYPIAPDLVFEALRKSLIEFGQTRAVLYLMEAFEPKISADLITLYADVNQRLIAFGVLPEIRYRIAKADGGSGSGHPGAPADAVPGDPAAAAAARAGYPGSAYGTAAGAHGAAAGAYGAGAHGAAGGHAGLPAGAAAAGHSAIADGAEPTFFGIGPESGSGAAAIRSGSSAAAGGGIGTMSAQAVSDLADQLGARVFAAQSSAARLLSDPEQFGTVGQSAVPAASEQLLDALTRLQETVPQDGQDIATLVSTARTQSSAAAREHGSPLERLIIETVSLVFEHVYEDEAIADAIKQQLLRLQVAAFKAALIDPTFFARPEHPMRRFIDRIAAIGSDPDFETQPGTPLVVDIAELMSWILASFERDLALFDEALTRVDTIVTAEAERRRERLAKIAAAAEKAEQLEATRREIRDSLLQPLAADTPEFVLRFVAEQWTEVVARISAGAQHTPFEIGRARRTIDLLCWSIAPKRPSDIGKLAAALPQLIADLSRGLSFIAFAEAERELFFSELLAWHGATIEEAKRNARLPQPAAEPAPAGAAAQTAPPVPVAAAAPVAAAGAPVAAVAAPAAAAGSPAVAAGTPAATAGAAAAVAGVPAATAAGTPDGTAAAVPGAADAAAGESSGDGGTLGVERSDDVLDTLDELKLTNGSEVELIGVRGEAKRYKLGWISPARTVFVFSRYPRDHWTARRPMLNSLLAEGRLRVISRSAGTGRAIEALKNR